MFDVLGGEWGVGSEFSDRGFGSEFPECGIGPGFSSVTSSHDNAGRTAFAAPATRVRGGAKYSRSYE